MIKVLTLTELHNTCAHVTGVCSNCAMTYASSMQQRMEEAEETLMLIGDKAVVDWDDVTVGQVDAAVKYSTKYIEWARDLKNSARQVDVLTEENEALRAGMKQLQEVCDIFEENSKHAAEESEGRLKAERDCENLKAQFEHLNSKIATYKLAHSGQKKNIHDASGPSCNTK